MDSMLLITGCLAQAFRTIAGIDLTVCFSHSALYIVTLTSERLESSYSSLRGAREFPCSLLYEGTGAVVYWAWDPARRYVGRAALLIHLALATCA
eukprot:4643229-Amphidinium_carterae.3